MGHGVRRVRPDEGLRLRALRLRALADAPWAFGSTLAREQAFAESVWHERTAQGAAGETAVTYVAEDAARWIGMATGLVSEALPSRLDLVGMFVEPDARGRGVGRALVETVLTWARARRADAPLSQGHHDESFGDRALPALRLPADGQATTPMDHTPTLLEQEMVVKL